MLKVNVRHVVDLLLEPICDAVTRASQKPKSKNPPCAGHADCDRPIEHRRRRSQNGITNDCQHVIYRVGFKNHIGCPSRQCRRHPDDGRDVKRHLNERTDNLRHIAKPRAENRAAHSYPQQIERNNDKPRNGPQSRQRDALAQNQAHKGVDEEVVPKNDRVAPVHTQHIDEKRNRHLPNHSFDGSKGRAAFGHNRAHEGPHDETDRQKRQVAVHRRFEHSAENDAQSGNHDRHAHRDPKRSQDRTAVALTNVLPAKNCHQPQLAECRQNVFERKADVARNA